MSGPDVTNQKTETLAGRAEYRLITKKAAEAERELQVITHEKSGNWKPILMSSTGTEVGVVVSILFEHVIGS
jgi:hypothetical protein